jgi:ABC-type transport system substrate-binding protein
MTDQTEVSAQFAQKPRDDDYIPRDGAPSGSTGGKRVYLDKVIWRYLPDPWDAAEALVKGEVDWWQEPEIDFVHKIDDNPDLQTFLLDPLGRQGWLRPNWNATDVINPAVHFGLSGAGPRAWFGWPDVPELEKLVIEWVRATDEPKRQRLADEAQRVALDEVMIAAMAARLGSIKCSLTSGLALSCIFPWMEVPYDRGNPPFRSVYACFSAHGRQGVTVTRRSFARTGTSLNRTRQ